MSSVSIPPPLFFKQANYQVAATIPAAVTLKHALTDLRPFLWNSHIKTLHPFHFESVYHIFDHISIFGRALTPAFSGFWDAMTGSIDVLDQLCHFALCCKKNMPSGFLIHI